MDDLLPRRAEAALGLESGCLGVRLRAGKLSAKDRPRLKAWIRGVLSRQASGVFVYNHWLDLKGPGLYKSKRATVRRTKAGWEASVRGITTHGVTAREAAERLSAGLHAVIALADAYREITQGAKRPKRNSGAGGSRRGSSRGRGRKG